MGVLRFPFSCQGEGWLQRLFIWVNLLSYGHQILFSSANLSNKDHYFFMLFLPSHAVSEVPDSLCNGFSDRGSLPEALSVTTRLTLTKENILKFVVSLCQPMLPFLKTVILLFIYMLVPACLYVHYLQTGAIIKNKINLISKRDPASTR